MVAALQYSGSEEPKSLLEKLENRYNLPGNTTQHELAVDSSSAAAAAAAADLAPPMDSRR